VVPSLIGYRLAPTSYGGPRTPTTFLVRISKLLKRIYQIIDFSVKASGELQDVFRGEIGQDKVTEASKSASGKFSVRPLSL
jgi:hypothetical protein